MSTFEESAAAATPTPPVIAWPAPIYAWYVMVVLIVAYSFAIVDRSIISLLVIPIKADLGITDTQIGLLQGLAFAICYTTFGLVLGFVTDRTDRRKLLSFSIFMWSAATIACGFSNSFQTLFISRIFVGLGEAGVLPIAGSLVADYLPPKTRAKAYGMLLLGGTFGSAMGNWVGGNAIGMSAVVRSFSPEWIDVLRNWQIAFLIVGVPGIVVSVIFFFTVREPIRRERSAATGFTLAPLLAHVRRNKLSYTTLLSSTVLNVMCIYAQIAWGATFLIRVRGWTPETVAIFMMVSSVIGATSAFSVGWLMSKLIERGRRDAPLIAALIHGACSLVFGPLAYMSPPLSVMVVFYLALSFTSNWSTSAALMGVSQITPNELRGQVVAFYTLLSGLISLTAGAYSVGALSDHLFTDPLGIRYSLATVYFLAGGTSVLLVCIGRAAFRASAQRALAWSEPE